MMRFTGITFDPNFQEKAKNNFDRAQKFIDSEVLRLSDPYVPFRTGMLKKSGISGTVIGSGVVMYTAPYGKRNYYENAGRGKEGLNASSGTKGLRGKFWFERMKADHKDEILKREYVMEFPELKDGFLLVDFLGNEPIEYVVEKVPCDPVYKRYTDGSCMKQFLFIFASREFYSEDVNRCIENNEFYEIFEDWISERNFSGILPDLGNTRSPVEISVLTGGYAFDADTNTARYQIQLRLLYEEV